jgi:hypothetical protein
MATDSPLVHFTTGCVIVGVTAPPASGSRAPKAIAPALVTVHDPVIEALTATVVVCVAASAEPAIAMIAAATEIARDFFMLFFLLCCLVCLCTVLKTHFLKKKNLNHPDAFTSKLLMKHLVKKTPFPCFEFIQL